MADLALIWHEQPRALHPIAIAEQRRQVEALELRRRREIDADRRARITARREEADRGWASIAAWLADPFDRPADPSAIVTLALGAAEAARTAWAKEADQSPDNPRAAHYLGLLVIHRMLAARFKAAV